MPRIDGRNPSELRKISIEPGLAPHAHGSALIRFGNTQVICAAMVEEVIPRWMKEQGVPGGWLTAEYSMLPYSTISRKPRDASRGKPDGRGTEIQRLIGRSLRASIDLKALGPRTIWVDCDVLQADGGTRTAAITGACVALELACLKLLEQGKIKTSPIVRRVAAVSAGIVNGDPLLDLNYVEDKDASVDVNIVMTDALDFVEVQASGEEAVFNSSELDAMLALARGGIQELLTLQKKSLNL